MIYKLPILKNVEPVNPPCRKKIYNSPEEAQEAIEYIRQHRRVRNLHAYKCTICGFWHLTSKSKM